MRKFNYIFVLILAIVVLIQPINAKAETCSSEKLANLKELANNIEIKKAVKIFDDIPEYENSVYYTIKIINYSNDLLIRVKMYDRVEDLDVNASSEILFPAGQKIIFYIYSFSLDGCLNNLLRTINVDLDYYNIYYYKNKEKCEQYPNFKYCKEYLDTRNIELASIDKMFEDYIASNQDNSSNNKNIINNRNIIYYAIGLVGVILILGIVILIIRKKKKKDFI